MPLQDDQPEDPFLFDELKQLGGDARAYAEAEIAFQKARAEVAAKGIKDVALFGLVAFTVAVFGLGALVVGLLIALAPLVTAWGATAIVAGGLFAVALILILVAKARWSRMVAILTDKDPRG
ncbi:MAG: phage holin family protein [Novosphingobium sp.]